MSASMVVGQNEEDGDVHMRDEDSVYSREYHDSTAYEDASIHEDMDSIDLHQHTQLTPTSRSHHSNHDDMDNIDVNRATPVSSSSRSRRRVTTSPLVNLIRATKRKPGRPEHVVWKYFKKLNMKPHPDARCLFCSSRIDNGQPSRKFRAAHYTRLSTRPAACKSKTSVVNQNIEHSIPAKQFQFDQYPDE